MINQHGKLFSINPQLIKCKKMIKVKEKPIITETTTKTLVCYKPSAHGPLPGIYLEEGALLRPVTSLSYFSKDKSSEEEAVENTKHCSWLTLFAFNLESALK